MAIQFTIYCGLKVGKDDSPLTIHKSSDLVHELADTHLKAYTATQSVGCWRGKREPTLVITYLSDLKTDITKVNGFAHAYKWGNHQETVLIVEQEVDINFY